MKKFFIILTVSLFFIIGGCKETIEDAVPDSISTTLLKQTAPFTGFMEGTGIPNCQTMETDVVGTGYGSFIGNFSSVAHAKMNPYTQTFYEGTQTSTNARGDQMITTWTGSWEVTNTNPYTTHYIMDFTITGGTGALEGITGELHTEADGVGVPCTAIQFQFTDISGYIEFPDYVPFKGTLEGYSIPNGSCGTGGQSRMCYLGGSMPHFGDNISVEFTHCNQPLPIPGWGIGGELREGVGTLVSDNGDELYFQYDGRFRLDQLPPSTTYADVYTSMTILGGTGRFENAIGTCMSVGRQDNPLGSSSPTYVEITGFYKMKPKN